jgi:6-phosphogluconolactonase (cycloisomerase 2 family)
LNNPERNVLGKLAELEFEKECLKRNLTIAKPVIDNQVGWDYIVDFGHGLKKIQVKKIGRNTNNLGKEYKTIQLNGRRSYQKQDGSWKHSKWKYTEESYDFLVGIDLELDEMYLFPFDALKGLNRTQTPVEGQKYKTGLDWSIYKWK